MAFLPAAWGKMGGGASGARPPVPNKRDRGDRFGQHVDAYRRAVNFGRHVPDRFRAGYDARALDALRAGNQEYSTGGRVGKRRCRQGQLCRDQAGPDDPADHGQDWPAPGEGEWRPLKRDRDDDDDCDDCDDCDDDDDCERRAGRLVRRRAADRRAADWQPANRRGMVRGRDDWQANGLDDDSQRQRPGPLVRSRRSRLGARPPSRHELASQLQRRLGRSGADDGQLEVATMAAESLPLGDLDRWATGRMDGLRAVELLLPFYLDYEFGGRAAQQYRDLDPRQQRQVSLDLAMRAPPRDICGVVGGMDQTRLLELANF